MEMHQKGIKIIKQTEAYMSDIVRINPKSTKNILSGEIKWFILQPKNQKQKKLCQTLQQK